jgi:hypothetical protein
MSIKLLPASVNPVDPSQARDESTSLVRLTQSAITPRAGQIGLVPSTPSVPSADTFAWSSSTRRGEANLIYGTPVDDSESDVTGRSGGEYVSGWAWSRPVERTAVAIYLSYATGPAGWGGRLIDLYA